MDRSVPTIYHRRMVGESDPSETLNRVLQAGRQVRLGKGVVAKTSHATIALIGLWITIAFRLGPDWKMDLALLFAGLIGTAVLIWWVRGTHAYAERNPAQAMLEGAEFLEYRRLEEQAKGAIPVEGKPGDTKSQPKLGKL